MDLTRSQLLSALEELDRQLGKRGTQTVLRVIGGAAIALLYDDTRMTADVDSVFENYAGVRSAVEEAATVLGLPHDWVNSQVSDLALPFDADERARVLPIGEYLTLRIASPEFLLYTKLVSTRRAEQDFEDAVMLAEKMGLRSSADIERAVSSFGAIDGALELYIEDIADEL